MWSVGYVIWHRIGFLIDNFFISRSSVPFIGCTHSRHPGNPQGGKPITTSCSCKKKRQVNWFSQGTLTGRLVSAVGHRLWWEQWRPALLWGNTGQEFKKPGLYLPVQSRAGLRRCTHTAQGHHRGETWRHETALRLPALWEPQRASAGWMF